MYKYLLLAIFLPSLASAGLYATSGALSISGQDVSAGSVNVTGSTVPANGIYLPSANTLGFATNTTLGPVLNSSQQFNWNASITPGTSTTGAGMLIGSDRVQMATNIGNPFIVNRYDSTDGRVATFRRGGTDVGWIASASSGLNIDIVSVSSGGARILTNGGTVGATFDLKQHAKFGTTQPTLSSCGTGPSLSANSSDTHGTVTGGTGATACTVTFANSGYTNAPDCTVSMLGGIAYSYTVSTTAIVLTSATLGTGKFSYTCFGN